MRKTWAVFEYNKLIEVYWTQREAEYARRPGQHVRQWREGGFYDENGKPARGAWTMCGK